VKAHIKDAHADEIWTAVWKKNKIITGSVDGKVIIWNSELEKQHEIEASPLAIVSVTANTKGVAVSTGLDGQVRIWDVETGELKSAITPEPGINAWNLAVSQEVTG